MLSVKRVWWASSLSFAMSMMMILKLIRTGNIVHNQFAAATYTYYIYTNTWLTICIVEFLNIFA